MQYKRIFLFGCSWTAHHWPTWANIIKYSTTNIPVEIWARGGIGNVGIFHRMVECNLKNKFTADDLIIVQWSSWTREDRYNKQWITYGNVLNNPFYDQKFIRKYWSWDNDIIKNCTAIISAETMFNIAYHTSMTSLENPTEKDVRFVDDNLEELYKFYVKNLPTIEEFPNHINKQFNNTCCDNHPDIETHLYFYENILRKNFPFLPECKCRDELLLLSDKISKSVTKNMSHDETGKIILKLSYEFDPYLHTKIGF